MKKALPSSLFIPYTHIRKITGSFPVGGYLMKRKKNEPLVNYDPSSDVLYLVTKEGVEAEFREVLPGVNVEMDEEGHVIGVKILAASKVLGNVLESLYRKRKAA